MKDKKKNKYSPITNWKVLIPGSSLVAVWILLFVLAIFLADTSSLHRSLQDVEEEPEPETEEEHQARVDAYLDK